MIKNKNCFCRLEFHNYKELENANSYKDASIFLKNEEFNVEEFSNINSLKDRLKDLYERWQYVPRVKNSKRKISPVYYIYNSNNQRGRIGYTNFGWRSPYNYFYGYISQSFTGKFGVKRYLSQFRPQIEGEELELLPPNLDWYFSSQVELDSEEIFDVVTKAFLQNRKFTEEELVELRQKLFYPEMVKRGYISILNSEAEN